MAKDRNIKYADYDYGQPESEKRGLLIRNRSGDKRVLYAGLAFFVVPLVLGAVFSIPAVDDFFEGHKSTAELAFGQEYFDMDNCVNAVLQLEAFHAQENLDGASALLIRIEQQTRSKGMVAVAETTVDLSEIDLDDPPAIVRLSLTRDDFEVVSNSRPTQCAYSVDIIR